jgi:hypothetical protein
MIGLHKDVYNSQPDVPFSSSIFSLLFGIHSALA